MLIPVSEILCDNDLNCRGPFTLESVQELAGSIQQMGMLEPVLVRPVPVDDPASRNAVLHPAYESRGIKYILVFGYRRWHAHVVINKAEFIECTVKEMSEEQATVICLLENIDRKDLNVMEEARAIRRAFPAGTDRSISEAINRTKTWVSTRLRLLQLPEEVQEALAAGRILATDAPVIFSEEDAEGQIEAMKKLVKQRAKGQTPRETRAAKKRKSKSEIEAAILTCMKGGLGMDLLPRGLAWVIGGISDAEFYADIDRIIEDRRKKLKDEQSEDSE